MLAGFLGISTTPSISLEKGVDIEMASGELSEQQRQEVSMKADLDAKAPVHRVLDFLEEVLLALASGEPSEEALLTTARRLLGATGGILEILDTLRSLVSDSDIGGTVQRKCEPAVDSGVESAGEEAAFLARRPRRRHRFPSLICDGSLSRATRVVALSTLYTLHSTLYTVKSGL